MNLNAFNLEGKTILITGASSGIGKATAILCSHMGAKVVATARNSDRLNETYSKLVGESNEKIQADITNPQERNGLVEASPKLDGIIHCAGITDPVMFQFLTEERLRNIFDVNFFAPVLLTKELLKNKKIAKNASIVFISSIAGLVCSSLAGSSYSASKGAVNGVIKGMALDLAPQGIRVNSVCPGMIDTGIFENSSISSTQLSEDKKKYPLKRYGKPEEVAYAALYFISDMSSWTTGSSLIIDGGYTLL